MMGNEKDPKYSVYFSTSSRDKVTAVMGSLCPFKERETLYIQGFLVQIRPVVTKGRGLGHGPCILHELFIDT